MPFSPVIVPRKPLRSQQKRLQQREPAAPQGVTAEEEALLSVLGERHPDYDKFLPDWVRYLDCYEGTNISSYIYKHLRESTKSLEARQKRCYYYNYCQPVIDLYTHYIFSKPAIRKESPQEVLEAQSFEGVVQQFEALAGGLGEQGSLPPNEELSEWRKWLKNVDRRGNSIDRFMSKVTRGALTCGHVYVLVDMPPVEAPMLSEQQRIDEGIQPYLSMYYPTEMLDWGVSPDDNKFTWVRFYEPLADKQNPFQTRDSVPQDNRAAIATAPKKNTGKAVPKDGIYRTWTRDFWITHKIEKGRVSEVGRGPHYVGEVPVVVVYNKNHSLHPLFGQSLISEINKINISVLNWCSLIDEEIYQKTLNILCMQRGQEDRGEIVIGSDNTLEWDGTTPPYFLAPSSDPGAFIAAQVVTAREEIYRLAKLGGGLGLVSPQRVSSGIAQAFEFNETNRTLTERADELEKAENEIHRLWNAWVGIEWMGTVDYPEDFSVESFMDELDIALKAKQAVRSPTFKREVEKRIAHKMLHNANPIEKNLISAEIDILPELVVGPFGPMYFDPTQQPSATPTNADEISRSPFDKGPMDQGNGEDTATTPEKVDKLDLADKKKTQKAKEKAISDREKEKLQAKDKKAKDKKKTTGTPPGKK